MRVRRLSPPNLGNPSEGRDMQFGRGALDYIVDQPEAPAQCVETRLQLYTGEWFLDLTEGTPWRTQVLGKRTGDTRDPVIRARMLETQGVTGIAGYDSRLDRETRGFTVAALLDTTYGLNGRPLTTQLREPT